MRANRADKQRPREVRKSPAPGRRRGSTSAAHAAGEERLRRPLSPDLPHDRGVVRQSPVGPQLLDDVAPERTELGNEAADLREAERVVFADRDHVAASQACDTRSYPDPATSCAPSGWKRKTFASGCFSVGVCSVLIGMNMTSGCRLA